MSYSQSFTQFWSKSALVRPKDHLVSHVKLNDAKFVPSFDRYCLPTDMNWMLGWEYGRIWLAERKYYSQKRAKSEKRKIIKNNYEDWIAKRQAIRKAAFV